MAPKTHLFRYGCLYCHLSELVGKPSETDSIKFKISSKTSRGKKGMHKKHKRQPGEQQFPTQVVTG